MEITKPILKALPVLLIVPLTAPVESAISTTLLTTLKGNSTIDPIPQPLNIMPIIHLKVKLFSFFVPLLI